MLDKLGYFQGGHLGNEQKNIELAIILCETENAEDIFEIVKGLEMKNIANDCIKVLYEIGERKPELVTLYVKEFLNLLNSKNNRLVWGGMCALATIAEDNAKFLFDNIEIIIKAYRTGSVITIDNSIIVFSKIAKSNVKYEEKIMPIIINHLKNCRTKEIPQHAERAMLCINKNNKKSFLEVINKRKDELSEAQLKRINKFIKILENL